MSRRNASPPHNSIPPGILFVAAIVLVLLVITAVPLFERPPEEPADIVSPVASEETMARVRQVALEIQAKHRRWRAGITSISHLSPAQFQGLLGARPPDQEITRFAELNRAHRESTLIHLGVAENPQLPQRWDWRDFNGLTPARHQQLCGACWAFSAAGALEALLLTYDAREVDLSEQHVLDCNYDNYGCGGGWMTSAYRLWREVGAYLEEDIPYVAQDNRPCHATGGEPVGMVTNWSYVADERESLKRALLVTPLAVGIHAYSDFQHYQSGVYEHEGDDQINHAVLLVGWDDDLGAWIIKNSWGSGWGQQGFAYVAYDCCGLGSYAHRLRIAASRPLRIHHTPLGDTLATGNPLEIRAIVGSIGRALDPGSVLVGLDHGDGFTLEPMEHLDGSIYEGTFRYLLPVLDVGAELRYYIQAADTGAFTTQLPAGGPAAPFAFRIWRHVLQTGFEEPTTWLQGVAGDDATGGRWEHAVPEGTLNIAGHPIQPAADHTPEGSLCFVTGALAGEDALAHDVDGGATTLESPRLSLGGLADATLRFWLYFTNQRGPAPWEDPFVLQASNNGGQSWATLFETTHGACEWQRVTVRLDSLLTLTDAFQLRFVAADRDSDSLVEALIDDLEILSTTVSGTGTGEDTVTPPPPPPGMGLRVAPNPTWGNTTLTLALPAECPVEAAVFDISGRRVRMLVREAFAPGIHQIPWDGRDQRGGLVAAGRYWARVTAGQATLVRELTVLR